jgi:hypothetical protein
MKLESKLQLSLSKRQGSVVLRRDLAALGSPSHLSAAIRGLLASGRLVRLGSGIYAKAKPDSMGRAQIVADPKVLAQEVFDKLGISVCISRAGNADGLPLYIMDTGMRRVSRQLKVQNAMFNYGERRRVPRTAHFTLPADLERLPKQGVRDFVERFAQAHGVAYRRSGLDDFAEAITAAAGDDVRLDTTGKLLVAIGKKNLMSGRQIARLMTNHLTETKSVRPIRGLPDCGLPAQR